MTTNHIREVDGEYRLSAAAVLMLASHAITSKEVSTAVGKARGRRLIQSVIGAAQRAGFAQAEILETLLLRGDNTRRTWDMCAAATDTLGRNALLAAFNEAGWGTVAAS